MSDELVIQGFDLGDTSEPLFDAFSRNFDKQAGLGFSLVPLHGGAGGALPMLDGMALPSPEAGAPAPLVPATTVSVSGSPASATVPVAAQQTATLAGVPWTTWLIWLLVAYFAGRILFGKWKVKL